MSSKKFYNEKVNYLILCVEMLFDRLGVNDQLVYSNYLLDLIREGIKLDTIPWELAIIVMESSVQGLFEWQKQGRNYTYTEAEETKLILSIFTNNKISLPESRMINIEKFYNTLHYDAKKGLELLQETFLYMTDGSDSNGENSEYNIREILKLLRKHGVQPPVRKSIV